MCTLIKKLQNGPGTLQPHNATLIAYFLRE